MTVPQEVKLARHAGDLDDDGHDTYGASLTAADIPVSDAGGYFTTDNVEAALQELGARPTLLGRGDITVGDISTVTDDTKYNAWPSIARMQDGRLILVYTKGDTHHLDETGKAVAKIGTEILGGDVSWGTEADVYDDPSVWVSATGVAVLSTGRVIVSGFYGAYASNPLDGAFITYSDDDGATWSSIVVVNSTLSSYSYGSGGVVELANGDLLQCVEGKNTGDTYSRMVVLKSTDQGATWGSQVTIATGTRNYYEACPILLDDGSLLVMLRTSDAAGDIYQSTSTDDGATWSAPTLAFAGHGQPNIIQLPSGTLLSLTRENKTTGTGGTWAYTSVDRGVTWSAAIDVDLTPYEMEYADAVQLLDGRILGVEGYQPTSSTSNSDIKQVYMLEGSVPIPPSSAGDTTADYLIGTADPDLPNAIVVGTTPGGELGGTWPSPTVDTTHSGSSHAATQAAAEATAAAALAAHVAASAAGTDHVHIDNLRFSGDASTTDFELPAAPFDDQSLVVWVAGTLTDVTLSGAMLTTMTFGSAPGSGTDNIRVDLVAAAA